MRHVIGHRHLQDAELRHRLGFGEKAALLIVDFVNGFTDPAKFGGGNIQEAIDATVGLAFCRERGVPVAHTRVIFADDAADANIMCMKCLRSQGSPRTRRTASRRRAGA